MFRHALLSFAVNSFSVVTHDRIGLLPSSLSFLEERMMNGTPRAASHADRSWLSLQGLIAGHCATPRTGGRIFLTELRKPQIREADIPRLGDFLRLRGAHRTAVQSFVIQ